MAAAGATPDATAQLSEAAADAAAAPASTARPKITHVLFDMDGLLLDTETFYTVAQQKILEQHGKQFSWELKAKMMGLKAMEAAQVLINDTGLHGQLTPEAFLVQREAILDALFPTATLMPGAERLVRHLAAHSIPIAVATSSHKRHFNTKTQQHGPFFGLFNHVVTGDKVTNGKPHPEIFATAAAAFQTPPAGPQHCLVFEDAPSGVQAALAAGMHVVMVPDPNLDRSLCREATQVLDSLEAFKPEDWGLPPYQQ